MQNEVTIILNDLCNNTSCNIKIRLKAIDKIIYGFKKNSVEPTVPNIINALKSVGIKMSASSIYNKTVRGKQNPYRVLFDAWVKNISDSKLHSSKINTSTDFISMTDTDFSSISNEVVKFKVQMLFNELKSARHQINMLKQIQNLPIVTDTGSSLIFNNKEPLSKHINYQKETLIKKNMQDTHIYREALEQFLNDNNKLEYDENGCLVAKKTIRKGDLLSDINFRDAIIEALNILSNKNS